MEPTRGSGLKLSAIPRQLASAQHKRVSQRDLDLPRREDGHEEQAQVAIDAQNQAQSASSRYGYNLDYTHIVTTMAGESRKSTLCKARRLIAATAYGTMLVKAPGFGGQSAKSGKTGLRWLGGVVWRIRWFKSQDVPTILRKVSDAIFSITPVFEDPNLMVSLQLDMTARDIFSSPMWRGRRSLCRRGTIRFGDNRYKVKLLRM